MYNQLINMMLDPGVHYSHPDKVQVELIICLVGCVCTQPQLQVIKSEKQ